MVSCIRPLIKDRSFDSSQINVKETKKIIGIAKRIAARVVFFLLSSVAPIMTIRTQRFKDKCRGHWQALKSFNLIDGFADHSMGKYHEFIYNMDDNGEQLPK